MKRKPTNDERYEAGYAAGVRAERRLRERKGGRMNIKEAMEKAKQLIDSTECEYSAEQYRFLRKLALHKIDHFLPLLEAAKRYFEQSRQFPCECDPDTPGTAGMCLPCLSASILRDAIRAAEEVEGVE